MDEIVKKLAGLGFPGILVVIAAASGGGSAAIVALITGLGGPFGIIGGLGILAMVGSVGEVVAGYGIETIIKSIYAERSKTESVRFLLKEIKDLPITDELKVKLRNELTLEPIPEPEEVEIETPTVIEIVED
ncbi:hypothetical protein [Nodularia sphaerocarpa]|uniref:hypothetical protein n=1 Tax=Nodularia sphaerocarpa TaxID=137816 RepID=UPI001EFB05C6|nr:hypothetical protein [Nodularia sphaerocarpa]MDB9373598.1 hypothetical protein [Nodularia sphaerocarpa CS-585]MDB9379809.1 hypothetical protein [Nodularia sphaerocarpa CS-585A2]ULP74385.1 hypothetical protein BDGGKGIB_04052 [Nodularia sphaerocarpa UHCC 0038]